MEDSSAMGSHVTSHGQSCGECTLLMDVSATLQTANPSLDLPSDPFLLFSKYRVYQFGVRKKTVIEELLEAALTLLFACKWGREGPVRAAQHVLL